MCLMLLNIFDVFKISFLYINNVKLFYYVIIVIICVFFGIFKLSNRNDKIIIYCIVNYIDNYC